jgi:hypothetical protein
MKMFDNRVVYGRKVKWLEKLLSSVIDICCHKIVIFDAFDCLLTRLIVFSD